MPFGSILGSLPSFLESSVPLILDEIVGMQGSRVRAFAAEVVVLPNKVSVGMIPHGLVISAVPSCEDTEVDDDSECALFFSVLANDNAEAEVGSVCGYEFCPPTCSMIKTRMIVMAKTSKQPHPNLNAILEEINQV